MIFSERLQNQINKKQSHVCVGLDTDLEFLKKDSANAREEFRLFNSPIIDATIDKAGAYKMNLAFYAAYGLEGYKAIIETVQYIKSKDPEAIVLADCKRSEMKRTAELSAKEIFIHFGFDGMITTPWFGYDTVEPYAAYPDRGIFVLCHDSNPTAGELQDAELKDGSRLYEFLTERVANHWAKLGNIHIEGPLTYPDILKRILEIGKPEQAYLAAGLGSQGGKIEDLAMFKGYPNFVVNASRSILYASTGEDFAAAAGKQTEEYRTRINEVLQ